MIKADIAIYCTQGRSIGKQVADSFARDVQDILEGFIMNEQKGPSEKEMRLSGKTTLSFKESSHRIIMDDHVSLVLLKIAIDKESLDIEGISKLAEFLVFLNKGLVEKKHNPINVEVLNGTPTGTDLKIAKALTRTLKKKGILVWEHEFRASPTQGFWVPVKEWKYADKRND